MRGSHDEEQVREPKLPLRDWILLPLFGLFMLISVGALTEFVGWRLFPWGGSHDLEHNCVIRNDPSTGVRGRPNSICWDKVAETPPVEYKFNSCGHRAGMECGTKPADTFRIVMIGSSFTMGFRVPQNQTLAAVLPEKLSRRTGQKIQLYNEGMAWGSPHTIDLRFNEIVEQKPDMILWVLTNYDLKYPNILFQEGWEPDNKPAAAASSPAKGSGFLMASWRSFQNLAAGKSFMQAVRDVMSKARMSLMLRHFLYESQHQYVIASLMDPRDETGYLRITPDENWQRRLQEFDSVAADMEARAHALGIPFVATSVPTRVQAAMISMGNWPEGYDPYALDKEFQAIITKHGGTFVAISSDFRSIPNPERYYLPVDGHPTARGHALISDMIAQGLLEKMVPTLWSTDRSQDPSEKSKQ